MFQSLLPRAISLGLWGSVCVLFSLFLASGSIFLSALILVVLLLLVAILIGPQFIAALWIIGSPTIFGFPNQILRALPFVTMERVLLLVLAGMVFLKIVFAKTKQLPLSFIEVLIIIFLSYALVSLVLHTTPERMSHDGWFFLQYALPMTAFIVSRRIQWSEHGLRILLASLTAVGFFLAIIGVLQLMFGVSIFSMNYQTIAQGHFTRAYGTFSNAHTYIATLFIFLALTLMQLNIYRDPFVRFILIFAMVVMVVGILFGQTRAPWGGAALAFFVIFMRDKNVRPILLVGGAIAFVAGTAILLTMMDQLSSLISRVTDMGTFAGRLTTWATAFNMIVHNPVFGMGFGADSFALHKSEFLTGVGSFSTQHGLRLGIPHNEYIHVTVLLGVVGLIIFIAVLYQLLKLLFVIHRDEACSPICRLLGLYMGAVVVGLLFNSLFSDTFTQDYFWTVTFFLAGLVSGMRSSNLRESPSELTNERNKSREDENSA